MPIAIKEWVVTVRALAEGEQLLIFRRGGMRDADHDFRVEHERFFLYPTFDHQPDDRVRASYVPELARALEDGVWAESEPPAGALDSNGLNPVPQPGRVRIRAWAQIAEHFTITDPRCVDALSPFYVWTTDYAEKRLEWRRRHPLHVLLLRAYRIPRPVTVRVTDEYGGCGSWLELQRDVPFAGTPAVSDDEFKHAAEEIRMIVDGGSSWAKAAVAVGGDTARTRTTHAGLTYG
jgi:hypothetical protein